MGRRRNEGRKVQIKLGERPEFKAQLVRLIIHVAGLDSKLLSFVEVSGRTETCLYRWLKHYGSLIKPGPLSVSVK